MISLNGEFRLHSIVAFISDEGSSKIEFLIIMEIFIQIITYSYVIFLVIRRSLNSVLGLNVNLFLVQYFNY